MPEELFNSHKVGAEGNTSRTPRQIQKKGRRLHCHASHQRQSKMTTTDQSRAAGRSSPPSKAGPE